MRRLHESLRAVGEVARNRDLRRLELAWAGSVLGNWGYVVALSVYAYDQGGAAAVGLVGVVRLLPAAIASPFVSLLADRMRRERVMVGTDLVRAALMAVAAATIAADGPPAAVYTLVGLSSAVGTGFRPAQAALLPSLARTPTELTAANLVSSTVESVGLFLGPALGGILLAVTNAQTVFAVNGASFVWSALLVLGVRGGGVPAAAATGARRPSFVEEASAGFRTLAGEPRARLLVSLYTAQTLVAGMLNVFLVVTALELADTGPSGVGVLTSAMGVGGIVGGVVAIGLVARQRLGVDFALGLTLFGLPLVLVAAWPGAVGAFLFVCLIGIGNTVVDVSAMTLMQRAIPDDVLARVFGVLESMLFAAMAVGAVLAPVLVDGLGPRAALAVAGAFLPLLALVSLRPLARLDATVSGPAPEIALLRAIPIFTPVSEPALEQLAHSLVRVDLPAGTEILRRGEPGDRFYVIERGTVAVDPEDGPERRLGPGESFGEIALLRDVPRTATVTAADDVSLLALDRDDFIGIVTGHPQSAEAADAVIASRLDVVRADLASV